MELPNCQCSKPYQGHAAGSELHNREKTVVLTHNRLLESECARAHCAVHPQLSGQLEAAATVGFPKDNCALLN
jgi:hypothetical protein